MNWKEEVKEQVGEGKKGSPTNNYGRNTGKGNSQLGGKVFKEGGG